MKPVVLASSSPRRKELLAQTGLDFSVDPIEVDENLDRRLKPAELAKTLALEKARAAAPAHPASIIIAADTFGVLDGRLIGKPDNENHARAMLRMLSGRRHTVVTGFAVLDTGTGVTISSAVETDVYFRELSDREIDDYVKTGEPLDKAGAYAIQGLGAHLVEKIEGDYHNVIGLPLRALAAALEKFGIELPGCSYPG